MTEKQLCEKIANYIKMHYPEQPFRFDTGADLRTDWSSAKRNKYLHGKFSKGYPDLFIPKQTINYAGMYLEIKATKNVPNSTHTRTQAIYHNILRSNGYYCEFCCGFEDCIEKINLYLS